MRREIEASQKPKGKREIEIEKTADWLLLPQESLKNRTARGYVEVVRDVKALRRQFFEESRHGAIPVLRELPVTETYDFVGKLLQAEENLLSYGLGENRSIRESVHTAVRGLNMRVLNHGENLFTNQAPEGPWIKKAYRENTLLDVSYVQPLLRNDEFHKKRVKEEGVALGFTADALWNPVYHSFLTMLIDTKTLLNRQERAMELPEEPGLSPSAIKRLRSVSHLTRAAIMLLEESHEAPLDKERFIKELNSGLAPFNTVVESL